MSEQNLRVEKRKRLIKKTGIIFLALVLLLTFSSKTINNLLLPEVDCTSPTSGFLETVTPVTGKLDFKRTEKILSYGNWKITEVNVKKNDEIKKGDVLAVVDEDEILLELKKRDFELEKLRNDLTRYTETFTNPDIKATQEDLAVAGQKVEKSEKELLDIKALYEAGAEPRKSVEDAEEKVDEAKRDMAKIQRQLDSLTKAAAEGSAEYKRTVSEKTKEIELYRLEIERIKKNMPVNGKIMAPYSGRVKAVHIEQGSNVGQGETLLEIIKENQKLSIMWEVNAIKSDAFAEGETVSCNVDTPEELSFDSIISSKEYNADKGLYLITADPQLEEEDIKALKEGQEVDVKATKRSSEYPIVLPNSAITKSGGRNAIYIVKERSGGVLGDETYVEQVEVNVEDSDDYKTAISDALEPDSKVVTYSTKFLLDGMQVKLR